MMLVEVAAVTQQLQVLQQRHRALIKKSVIDDFP